MNPTILITLCGLIALVLVMTLNSIANAFRLMIRLKAYWLGQLSLLACLCLAGGFWKGAALYFLVFWLLGLSGTATQLKEVWENR